MNVEVFVDKKRLNVSLSLLKLFMSVTLVIAPLEFSQATPTPPSENKLAVDLVGMVIESTANIRRLEAMLTLSGASTESIAAIRSDLLKSKPSSTDFKKMTLVDGKKLFIDGKDSGVRFNITAKSPLEVDSHGQSWIYDRNKTVDQNYFDLAAFFQQKAKRSSLWSHLIPEAQAQEVNNLENAASNDAARAGNAAVNAGNDLVNYMSELSARQSAAISIGGAAALMTYVKMRGLGFYAAGGSAALVGIVAGLVVYYGEPIAQAYADTDASPIVSYSCQGKSLVVTLVPQHGKGPATNTTVSMLPLRQGRYGTTFHLVASNPQNPDLPINPNSKDFYSSMLSPNNTCNQQLVKTTNEEMQQYYQQRITGPSSSSGGRGSPPGEQNPGADGRDLTP